MAKRKAAAAKPRFKVLSAGTFPFQVLLAVGKTEAQVKRRLAKMMGGEYDDSLDLDGKAGRTIMFESGASLIWLRDPEIDHCVLSHETQHAATFILNRIGVRFSDDSDEVYAYLSQYLMEQALK